MIHSAPSNDGGGEVMSGAPIDLRSDTVTRPTAAMREAMARAEVGDDVYGEDPTVNRLQEKVADLLGTEAALYVPSGSMANQIALKVHCRPGDDVIVGEGAHNFLYEGGAAGAIAGVQLSIVGKGGTFTVDDCRAAFKVDNHHYAPTRLVCIENTHNRGGGRIWPEHDVHAILSYARAEKLATHLDGARLWNVAAATERPVRELARGFDTVSVCLSKGLGAPVGSLICGTKELVHVAHRMRKMMGGAMRQSGILAAAGLHAIEHHRERLIDDHANARLLAERLHDAPGWTIDPASVHTNIVIAGVKSDPDLVVSRAKAEGVLLGSLGNGRVRLVTHLDVDRAQCERAADVLRRVA
jgi:threonine aldolase